MQKTLTNMEKMSEVLLCMLASEEVLAKAWNIP